MNSYTSCRIQNKSILVLLFDDFTDTCTFNIRFMQTWLFSPTVFLTCTVFPEVREVD